MSTTPAPAPRLRDMTLPELLAELETAQRELGPTSETPLLLAELIEERRRSGPAEESGVPE
jgi:hypothetical protein